MIKATAASRGECVYCETGTYQNITEKHREETCLPWAACDVGEYLVGGTTTSMGMCKVCVEGTFVDSAIVNKFAGLQSSCKAQQTCGKGAFFSQQSVSTERECLACPAGRFQPLETHRSTTCVGKVTAAACAAGTYLQAGPSTDYDDNECVPNGKCPSGMELPDRQASEPFSSSDCVPCKITMFRTHGDDLKSLNSCQNKTGTACPAGQYLAAGVSLSQDDNLCVACPAGTFSEGGATGGCTTKANPVSCKAGQYLRVGASPISDDNKCVDCPEGTWKSSLLPDTSCVPKLVTSCTVGQYLKKGPSLTVDDFGCHECPAGTYQEQVEFSGTSCSAKTAACPGMLETYLSIGSSTRVDDNVCIRNGLCPAGHFKVPSRVRDAPIPTDDESGPSVEMGDADTGAAEYTTAATTAPAPTQAPIRKGPSGYSCQPCPVGSFLSAISGAAECEPKSPRVCDAGYRLNHRTSLTANDWNCVACGVNANGFQDTYSGPNNALVNCLPKTPLPETCPAGSFIHIGTSDHVDDYYCAPCSEGVPAEGTYQPNNASTATQCYPKKAGDKICGPGQHLFNGDSQVLNDWRQCVDCPAGTWKAVSSHAESCALRTESSSCNSNQQFIEHDSNTRDNECKNKALCGPGEKTDPSDQTVCITCSAGTYSDSVSSASTCTNKGQFWNFGLQTCPTGEEIQKGDSTTYDDWGCRACAPGTYKERAGSMACTAKQVPAQDATTGDRCKPGYTLELGESTIRMDWLCAPKPQYHTICSLVTSSDSTAVMGGLRAGLPERTEPFLKHFTATMRTAGYTRVDKKAIFAVYGERFISDAERLPFPEGRPLLVLHDPPGGASFASFQNLRTQSKFRKIENTAMSGFGWDSDVLLGFRHEFGGVQTLTAAGVGAMVGATVEVSDSVALEVEAQWRHDEQTLYVDELNLEENMYDPAAQVSLEFTYQTSPDPNKAGPASDVFLMPALTFKVSEIWVVRIYENLDPPYGGADGGVCLIQGRRRLRFVIHRPCFHHAYVLYMHTSCACIRHVD
jgi:hypothetical protein